VAAQKRAQGRRQELARSPDLGPRQHVGATYMAEELLCVAGCRALIFSVVAGCTTVTTAF
jgi:hypothetical protein